MLNGFIIIILAGTEENDDNSFIKAVNRESYENHSIAFLRRMMENLIVCDEKFIRMYYSL
jgi:hypothetical protein